MGKRATHTEAASANARCGQRPTRMFAGYVFQLAVRVALLAVALWLFATNPAALNVTERFGLTGAPTFVDAVFVVLAADFLTKFFVRAPISSGSLKQYRRYQIPTAATIQGGREALLVRFREVAETGRRLAASGKTALADVFSGGRPVSVAGVVRRLLNDADFLKVFSFDERELAVDRRTRRVLYRDRAREIVPVVVFWAAFNALGAGALASLGVLNERTALLWSLAYFVFDMVCVVLWCPLQVLLMRNRCCTTCQIFNWDAIMVATPLLFAGGWFSVILLALAVVILLRWELAALRHPERFDERTNARLSCGQCTDRLCYLRKPFEATLERVDLVELGERFAAEASAERQQAERS